MRKPLHEVLRWPAWIMDVYAEFLQREMPIAERVEILLAELNANYAAVHRREGAAAPNVSDFLRCRDGWADKSPQFSDERYSDVDREIMKAFLK